MLCSSSPSIPAASDTTQRALIQLERRSEHWCLPLNPGKCEACFFSMDPHQANLLSHFSLLNYRLRFSPTYTFFGVTFNRTLIFYSSILAKGQVLRPYTKHPASSWEISKAGVSNLWASGGNIAHMSNRAEGRMKFLNWRSPLLWATIIVMSPEVRSISKKTKKTSSPLQHLRPYCGNKSSSVVAPSSHLRMEKNLYLSSVAYGEGFKRLFDDEPLEYCRNSLGILESSRGPRV